VASILWRCLAIKNQLPEEDACAGFQVADISGTWYEGYASDLYALGIIAAPEEGEKAVFNGNWSASLETALTWFLNAKNPTATTATHQWGSATVAADGVTTLTCTVCGNTTRDNSKTISAVENKDAIVIQWSGFETQSEYFYFEIEDSAGNPVAADWSVEGQSQTRDLKNYLSRLTTPGTYSFVLYGTDKDGAIIREEIGRLKDCIAVTVAGDPVEYSLAFDAETGSQTVTLTGNGVSQESMALEQWWDQDGTWKGTSCRVLDGEKIFTTGEGLDLSDGGTYDLRIVSGYALGSRGLNIMMTPASMQTYSAS
jgi:hypothetical protein